MVPVQVTEENGAPERCLAEQTGQPPDAGAGVEHERRRLAVACQRHAGGVAAVAREGVPGSRGRAPHAEHVHPHAVRSLLPTVALADLGQLVEVELDLAGLGHLARRDRDERGRPAAALEHGPLTDQRSRAEVGDLLTVDDHLDDAVEQQVDRVGLLALLREGGALP